MTESLIRLESLAESDSSGRRTLDSEKHKMEGTQEKKTPFANEETKIFFVFFQEVFKKFCFRCF